MLDLWIGSFDSIVSLVKPNQKGNWEGISLYYHTETGWYEDDLWKCEVPELFINQLESIDSQKLEGETRRVLVSLIDILKEGSVLNKDIYFEYE